MPTFRLTLEYEGTRYRGFQEQKNARTVAGELRRAIEDELGERVELGGAGRTDAGVHALAQTAHLKTVLRVTPRELAYGVNERLPPDIHLLALERAPERFHARHHATSRSYLFQISRRRTALAKRFVWWVKRPLDAGRLESALRLAVGRHDFAAFAEKADDEKSTLVVVEGVQVVTAGDLLVLRIVASHFLRKMVRRLVGAAVEVAAGELGEEELARLIAQPTIARGFDPARATAPPSGLFLERVLYPGDPPLGALAPVTPLG